MRLLFQTGKQRQCIEQEKKRRNASLPKLARILHIKLGKLRAYCYEGILMTDDVFERFSVKREFEGFIIGTVDEHWGQSKGGNNARGTYTKKITCPSDCEDLAELYGILLGDGNVTRKSAYKTAVYQIRVVGDSRHDKEYLLYHVKPLIEGLFGIQASIHKGKNGNYININAYGKNLVDFLEKKGFKPGDKIRNQSTIPNWIYKDTRLLRACLRGLYDTDGSVYRLTNQNSYQISFTNYNETLLNDVRKSLLRVGIACSRISRGRDITITRKSELRSFLKEIGFHNKKHLDKVKRWKLSPVV